MGDDTKVILRLPDEPRIEPPGEEDVISDSASPKKLDEKDAASASEITGDFTPAKNKELPDDGTDIIANDSGDDVLFVVDKDAFEKEYEVK